MKRLVAFLAAMIMLAASAALAEDLSGLTDEELRTLLADICTEMNARGMSFSEETVVAEYGPVEEQEAVGDRLMQFGQSWFERSPKGMLELCDPEWKAEQEDPAAALAGLLQGAVPVGAVEVYYNRREGKDRWHLTYANEMDRGDGGEPVKMYYFIDMVRAEDGNWYLDPRSLEDCEILIGDELDRTLLFYVPEGGERYHLNQNCPAVNEKYLPMQGCFSGWELNEVPYRDLKPCNVCGAPQRREEEAPAE